MTPVTSGVSMNTSHEHRIAVLSRHKDMNSSGYSISFHTILTNWQTVANLMQWKLKYFVKLWTSNIVRTLVLTTQKSEWTFGIFTLPPWSALVVPRPTQPASPATIMLLIIFIAWSVDVENGLSIWRLAKNRPGELIMKARGRNLRIPSRWTRQDIDQHYVRQRKCMYREPGFGLSQKFLFFFYLPNRSFRSSLILPQTPGYSLDITHFRCIFQKN